MKLNVRLYQSQLQGTHLDILQIGNRTGGLYGLAAEVFGTTFHQPAKRPPDLEIDTGFTCRADKDICRLCCRQPGKGKRG